MPDLSPYLNAAGGGETYVGVAVSYDPMGTVITAPSVKATATGSASGGTLPANSTPGFQYVYTFVGGTPAGESTPSPASTAYVSSGSTSSVALSVVAAGGTGTTARNIYRSSDGVNYFLIHTIADNTTTTWTDDGSGTLQGIVPPTTNSTNVGAPGLAPVPTDYIPITDDNISAEYDQAEPKVMRGTDLTNAIMAPTRLDEKGDITWLANPKLGPVLIQAHLGGYSPISSTNANTTGPTATSNGVSVLPVTLSGLAQFMQVDIGTGANKERTMVISYTPGTLTTYELSNVTNAHASSGLTVTIPVQTKYARSILSATLRKRIPLLCVENGAGDGDWAWAHTDMAVDQLDFTFSDKEAMVKTGFVGSGDPLFLNRGNTSPAVGATHPYNPNANDEAIALHVFTSRHCYLAAYGDPAATGTSSVRAAIGATNVTISSKAGLKKYAPMNAGQSYTYFRVGSAVCDVTYDEILTSLRPDIWYDAIRNSNAVSLCMGVWDNFGTALSPSYKGISLGVPSLRYKTTPRTTKIGDVDMWKRTAQALAGPGIDDYLVVYISA